MRHKKVAQFVSREDSDGSLFADFCLDLMEIGKIVEFSHIPSSFFTPYWNVINRLKKQGWRKGMPDYLIVTKQNVMFIELKIAVGGRLSVEQEIWLNALEKTGKVKVKRCNGYFDAVRFVLEVLKSEGITGIKLSGLEAIISDVYGSEVMR